MNPKEKLQAVLDAANNTTAAADTDITAAVRTLIDGYGQGGGLPAPPGYETITNEFDVVLAADSNPDVSVEHGLGIRPAYIVCAVKDFNDVLPLPKNVLVAGVWAGAGEFIPALACVLGGKFKRSGQSIICDEAGNYSYYIRDVNASTFSFSHDSSYSWPGGHAIHVACFGFKKKVV